MRVFGHSVRNLALMLMAAELSAIFLAIGYLCWTLYDLIIERYPGPATLIIAAFSVFIFVFLIAFGVYESGVITNGPESRTRAAAAAVGGATLAYLALYLWAPIWVSPKFAVSAAGIAYITIGLSRALVGRLRHLNSLRRRVLLVGSGPRAASVQALCTRPGMGISLETAPADVDHATLQRLIRERFLNEIVVVNDEQQNLPLPALFDAKLAGIAVTDDVNFRERETGRVDLDYIYPRWFLFGEGFRHSRLARATKRVADIILSLSALLLLAPVLVLTWVAVRLDSAGPGFYTQTRVGLNGQPFQIFKFRSMRTDAEAAGAQWAGAADPRITRFGHFIRKTRLDELPQLWNILRGDMSIVGPRPERPEFVAKLAAEIPFYNERHRVKPGLTGWAQINHPYGASVADTREKLRYDLYYMKHFSLFMDIMIMLKTLRVLFWTDLAR